MKILACLIVLIFLTIGAGADEFLIPFDCYPRRLQAKFAEKELKIDIPGEWRTEKSWGFIENRGQAFALYSYYPTTIEERQLVFDIIMEEIRGENDR